MPRLGWHKRVEESLEEVGQAWNYEILRPRVVHFIRDKVIQFEYHPDVCWLYRGPSKERPNAIVGEIESRHPDSKRVCGDTILAGQVVYKYAECYLFKEESRFGSELSEDVEVSMSGSTRRKVTYSKDERVLAKPNVQAFFLVVEDYKEDFERYVSTILEITGIVRDVQVFSLPRGLYKSQMINRLKRIKWLREKYKP